MVDVAKLSFAHTGSDWALKELTFTVPRGSRTILIGANGGQERIYIFCHRCSSHTAGKSTLLQILAGKKLISTPGTHVLINGKDSFRHFLSGVTFLGTEWFVVVLSHARLNHLAQGCQSSRAR
jgi:CCR4-NOT complex subunit CAF16